MSFQFLTNFGPRMGKVPWGALLFCFLMQRVAQTNHAAVVAGTRYQLKDRIGRETSFPYLGGHLKLFCDNGTGGQGDVYNTTAGWQNKVLMDKTEFELEPGMIGTQYGCIQDLKAFKIGPLHCDPFSLIPNVTCNEKQWCMISKYGKATCEEKNFRLCFLGGPKAAKEMFDSSFPKLPNVCTTRTDITKYVSGLCDARSENNEVFAVSDFANACPSLELLTLNNLTIVHDETLILSVTEKKWNIQYKGLDDVTCGLKDGNNKSYADKWTFKKKFLGEPKFGHMSLPCKLQISCKFATSVNLKLIEAFVIVFDPDASKYHVSISKKLKAEHLELTCTCNMPDGFVCGLTWEEPIISDELQKIPGDLEVKKLFRKTHTKPIVYTCYMQVLVFNYPNTFKLKRVPLETKYLQANVTIDTTDFDISNSGTDSKDGTDNGESGSSGKKTSNGNKSEDDKSQANSKSDAGTIALAVCMVILALLIAAAIIWGVVVAMRRRKQSRLVEAEELQRQKSEKAHKKDMSFVDSIANSPDAIGDPKLALFYEKKKTIPQEIMANDILLLAFVRAMAGYSVIAEHWDKFTAYMPTVDVRTLIGCRYTEYCLAAFSAVCEEGAGAMHMSYVTDIFNVRKYIACQAPTFREMEKFLRIIIDKGVSLVVCILSLNEHDDTYQDRPRYYDYFSLGLGESKSYGKCKITCNAVYPTADFITKEMVIQCGQTSQTINLLRYLSWPDMSVGDVRDVLKLRAAILRNLAARPGLTLMHCSAGLGRTGCMLSAMLCLQMFDFKGLPIDVGAICLKVRKERLFSIQKFSQYLLVFWALAVYSNQQLRRLAPDAVTTRLTIRQDIAPKAVKQAGSPTAKENKRLSTSSAKKVAGSPTAKEDKRLSTSSAKKVAVSKQSRASKSSN